MCGYLVKNTKRKSLTGELHPFFLLHLKIHGGFGLLSSLAGTMLAWQNPPDGKVCGGFVVVRTDLLWAALLRISEMESRTEPVDSHFINTAWKIFTYIFTTIFNPLVHIHYSGEAKSACWEEEKILVWYLQVDLITFPQICTCLLTFFNFPDPPCETWNNPCEPNPCRNGGMCSEDPGGFVCHCPDGFAGLRCHIDCTQPACLEGPDCSAGPHVRTGNRRYQISWSWKPQCLIEMSSHRERIKSLSTRVPLPIFSH